MTDKRVSDCKIELSRLTPVRECMENYDVGDPDEDWPHNVISTGTVAYACGALHRPGDTPPIHDHSVAEISLCRRLADEAATTMNGVEVGMGSESTDPFRPFFVAASRGVPHPTEIDETLIRRAFGGSIQPAALVRVEALTESGEWWSAVQEYYAAEEDADEDDVEDRGSRLTSWRGMIAWFRANPELHSPCFVSIGESDDPDLAGCVFPRLALGLTAAGSLVGICGYVVHT